MKSTLRYGIYFLIAIGILWLAFRNQDPSQFISILASANLAMVVFSVVILGVFSHILRAWRWHLMLKGSGEAPGIYPAFLAVMVGYLFNYGIPRSGELARCGMLQRTSKIPLEKSLGSVVAERLVDLLTLGLIVLLAFAIQFEPLWELWNNLQQNPKQSSNWLYPLLFGTAFAGLLGIWLVWKNPFRWNWIIKVQQKVKGFLLGFTSLTKMKNPVLFILLSLGIWMLYLLMMYFSFFNLPPTAHLGMSEALTVLAVGTFGMVIPAPGGVGSFHFFTTQALLIYNIQETHALAYATVVHGAQMIMFLILGPICMLAIGKIEKRKNSHGEPLN